MENKKEIIKQMVIKGKVKKLDLYDVMYRKGKPMISDKEFDLLIGELKQKDPNNEYFKRKKLIASSKITKCKLPVPMFSLDKLKSLEEIRKWLVKNNAINELLIITPKYDGLSILDNMLTPESFTRGDGVEGHNITNLFSLTKERTFEPQSKYSQFLFIGEGIITKKAFAAKYSVDVLGEEGFKNPRNMVASLFNPETKIPIADRYKDVHFIRYSMESDLVGLSKITELDYCNAVNKIEVPYLICHLKDLTEDKLNGIYQEFGKQFEIDGLVIDINDGGLRKYLGREKNNNPKYARAYKANFETIVETFIHHVTWQTSKNGLLKPVASIDPVELDGVTINNVTLYNARYVKDNNLGTFAKIKLIRSGGVIPKVIGVIQPGINVRIPKIIDKTATEWDDNEVELRLTKRTDKWNIQEILHFFKTFDVEEFGEPTVEAFYKAGYNTVKKILEMKEADISAIEGFASKKAKILLKQFQEKIKDGIELYQLAAASNLFFGMGKKFLKKIFDVVLKDATGELDIKDLIKIDDIGEERAQIFFENFDAFINYKDSLEKLIDIKIDDPIVLDSADLVKERICFTGFRDKAMEQYILKNGGQIVDSVNKDTTMLIVKELGSGSSKEVKAKQHGIKIINKEEALKFYK